MSKKVIITGVTGQAGSTMVDFLLNNTNDTIIGGVRRLSVSNHINLEGIKDNPRFKLIDLDVTDRTNTERVIEGEKPDYFINFAANSFVGNSWDMPENHFLTNAMAVLFQLESIRKYSPFCRYFNAGSSEEFGNVDYSPQDINHPFKPRSPYGAAKCAAHHIVKVYKESYDLYAVQGIMFNYESEKRGVEFVTRKISKGVARIKKSLDLGEDPQAIELGNLSARRDWSYCPDTMEGVWLMLHQAGPEVGPLIPKDYVLASGQTHPIREFVELAFNAAGIEGRWTGKGLEEKFISFAFGGSPTILVKVNPKFYRPAEVELLLGDSTPAREELGWEPKTSFKELVAKMVKHDLAETQK